MNVTDDDTVASGRLFFCLYDHEDFSDTLDALLSSPLHQHQGRLPAKENAFCLHALHSLTAKGLDKQIETMMIKPQ